MFEIVDDKFRKYPNQEIKLPTRGTKHSAGYDFFTNEDITIGPKETVIQWSDVKIKLEQNQALLIIPRSSIGIKKHIILANTIGLIDADYYNNEKNNGNIAVALYNYDEEVQDIKKGTKIVQGIIINYNTFEKITTTRKGGIGSTD